MFTQTVVYRMIHKFWTLL